jgi:small subunit ribosomal protein S20
LANSRQAAKRARQAEKRRMNNRWQKSRMYSAIKQVLQSISEKNVDTAKSAYVEAVALIDKLSGKGIIHKNKAARHKSRLNSHIKSLA